MQTVQKLVLVVEFIFLAVLLQQFLVEQYRVMNHHTVREEFTPRAVLKSLARCSSSETSLVKMVLVFLLRLEILGFLGMMVRSLKT